MAIQQGNVVFIMGCPKDTSTGFNFQVREKLKSYDEKYLYQTYFLLPLK
jgi:hypothetical protein